MTGRFVSVPADRLVPALSLVGAKVAAAGGTAAWTRAGREDVFELTPPRSRVTIRVFTTLDGGAAARGCGEDAVRICLVVDGRGLAPARKILRTAPRGAADRVQAFLDRLVETLREAYREACATVPCRLCGRPMARRRGPRGEFLGCTGFPGCRHSESIGGAR